MTGRRGSVAERFWPKVARAGDDECWVWLAATVPDGYGHFRSGRGEGFPEYVGAHRVAYTLTKGEIPPGQVVRHACDNPPCCNPAHLQLGTQADNIRDASLRNRLSGPKNPSRGERHPSSKLTAAQVAEIRRRHVAGETFTALAASFGVNRTQVSRICSGRSWAA